MNVAEVSDTLRKQVKRAAKQIKNDEEAVPELFTLDWKDIGVSIVQEIVPTEEEQEVDLDKPLLFKNFKSIETFKVSPKGQML